jgi:hypothetical protein
MPRRPNLTPEELDLIVAMRERGLGFAHIGNEIGCSSGAVYWHCLQLGVEPPKPQWPLRAVRVGSNLPTTYERKGRMVRLFTPEEDERLLQMREKGCSITEICKKLDRRSNSVVGRLMALARREARREQQAAITANCQPHGRLVESAGTGRLP